MSSGLPEGTIPKHDHSANFSMALEATGAVMIALAVFTVICRAYVRGIRKRTAGLDDLCIILAAILDIASGVCLLKITRSGLGRHMWQLSRHSISYTMKWFVICVFESYICLFFARASIGIFVLRMLSPQQTACRVAVYVGMVLNFAVTLTALCVDAVWCQPLEGLWDKRIPAKCLSGQVVGNANMACYAISAVTDILFASLPIAVCWSMQMDRKLKRNLSIIMLLSLITCACAIGKAVSVKQITLDFTYADVPVTFWAIFEVNIGIIVASLPALRQFYTITRSDISTYISRGRAGSPQDLEQTPLPTSYGSSQRSWPGTTSRQTMRTFFDDGKEDRNSGWSAKGPTRTTWRTLGSQSEDIELERQLKGASSPRSQFRAYSPRGGWN